MKKWMSLLLALVMALSLCSFAWADGEKATVVDDVLSATLAQEMAVLSAPAYTSGGQDEWVGLGLARSGYLEKGSKYFDDYYSRTVTAVDAAANGVKAPVGALLGFYDSALRAFRHVKKDNGTDGMATNQAAYAMTAYQRLARGQNSLYNMSNVRRDCADDSRMPLWVSAAVLSAVAAAVVIGKKREAK